MRWWTALKRSPSHSPCFLALASSCILPDSINATTMSRAISDTLAPAMSPPSGSFPDSRWLTSPETIKVRRHRQRAAGRSGSERAQARIEEDGGGGEGDQGEPAHPERRAHPEERGERADLELAERGEADRHHPRPARAPAQVMRHAQLEQALGEEVGEGARRV